MKVSDRMKQYIVEKREVYNVLVLVEAKDEHDARRRVADDDGEEVGDSQEYVRTLDPTTWTVYENVDYRMGFYCSGATDVYGARVWVHNDIPAEVTAPLARLSKWGAADAISEECGQRWRGYEFALGNFGPAVDHCRKEGLTSFVWSMGSGRLVPEGVD